MDSISWMILCVFFTFFQDLVKSSGLADQMISLIPDKILHKKFKIYIYDLPTSMNKDIEDHAKQNYGYRNCISLEVGGMGTEILQMGDNNEISVRSTDQFSLEVIIHHKLLKSPFRTLDPEEADVFYVPAYVGTHCMFYNNYFFTSLSEQLIFNLTDFLQSQKYFKKGKPHFSTIAKIHKEMATEFCPYLQYNVTRNITFLSIERETTLMSESLRSQMMTASQSVIVVPYPSFIHLVPDNIINNIIPIPTLDQRDVFILLPASSYCMNDFRCQVMTHFSHKTKQNYTEFKGQGNVPNMVFYEVTLCDDQADIDLVHWMQKSIFCLQPPGDSPTRKSFYDSINNGCIPVTFGNHSLQYAFASMLDYTKFTVSIPTSTVDTEKGIYNHLQSIDQKRIELLHTNLLQVIPYMQYSVTSDDKLDDSEDAMKLILAEIANKLL